MFFDIILLNSQHGGRFGIAWLMATRGLKFVTKKQLKELNLIKLCDDLKLFIISYSVSPKKRFSLRLSAILVNGMVKIFKEQTKILHDEVFSLISTIHIPSGIGYVTDSTHTEIFETPPTPVVKTKKKRGRVVAKETPEEILQTSRIDEMLIQLPDIEEVLRPTARSDEISIREEMPKRAEPTEDEFGLGILSGKEVEEELQSLLAKPREIPKDRSQYPSSSDSLPAPPQLIEVVVQVHAPRDDLSVPEHLQRETDEQVPVNEHISVPVSEMRQTTEPILATEPVLLVEPLPAPETVLEKEIHPLTESPAVVQTSRVSAPIEIDPNVPVEEATEIPKAGMTRRKQTKQFVEVQANEIVHRTAQITQKKEKLLFTLLRSKFVHINRCNENNGKFINESCQLSIPYTNALNQSLYNMLWTEEEGSENIQVRAAQLSKSLSLGGSVNLRGTDTISAQRSMLEPVSETGIRFSVQALQSLEQQPILRESARQPDDIVRQISIEEPVEPVFTPGKRKRLTTTDDEGLSKRRKDSVQCIPSIPLEKTVEASKEPVSVPEPIVGLDQEMELFTSHQTLLEPIPHTRKAPVSPTPSDYKLRQQNIINIVTKWSPSEGMITIEDICEKPINKLNIARAFSDLLILAANKFLILTSDENSLELKSIEKGPKLTSS